MIHLDWLDTFEENSENMIYDCIIASEVVYHEPLVEPLVRTIDKFLKPGGAAYLVSAKHRHCYLHFFHLMLSLGYTISTSVLAPPPKSNAYFTPCEELTVGWFCEGQYDSDLENLILVQCLKKI